MDRPIAFVLSIVLAGASASWLTAQTLADVARKEEDRRKTIKPSGRMITNRDLRAVPPPTAQPATAPGAPADTPPDQAGAGARPDAGDAKKADATREADTPAPRDDKAWRDRMARLRTQLDRDRTFAEALQTRINTLTFDFINRDDPAQRAVIETDRQKAIDELARVKKAVLDGTKAIVDLEEEARRAGVPAGWLR
jgi:hypothetical protein